VLDQIVALEHGDLGERRANLHTHEVATDRAALALATAAALEDIGVEVGSTLRSALSQAVLHEQAQRLERALEALEPAHREIIVLRKFEELSFPEIAVRMRRSDDACRMLLARALTALTLKMRSSS